jgi:hypothetical protein
MPISTQDGESRRRYAPALAIADLENGSASIGLNVNGPSGPSTIDSRGREHLSFYWTRDPALLELIRRELGDRIAASGCSK